MSFSSPPPTWNPIPGGPAPHPYAPRPQLLVRKIGAPLWIIIVLGIFAGLLMVLAGLTNPTLFVVGFIPAALFAAGAIAAYLWLDRWEPEPRRLLIYAFVWGGGFATVFSLVAGAVLGQLGILSGPFTGVALQAPLVEEFAKGLFLVLMLTGARRWELNTLTDCLVYAGIVGLGFAFIEDLLYLSGTTTIAETLLLAVLRLVFGIFAHPLFTSMTALGVFFSQRFANPLAKLGCIVLGYLGAVFLHATWNGGPAVLSGGNEERYFESLLGVYFLFMVPVFAAVVVVALKSRKREGEIFRRQLPRLVQEGLVFDQEAQWLALLPTRRARLKAVRSTSGAQGTIHVMKFCDAITELAFIRDRLDRGFGGPKTRGEEQELTRLAWQERMVALPALARVSRVPLGPGMSPPMR